MDWYLNIAAAFVAMQVLYCLVCYRNYRFVLSKSRKRREAIGKVVLVVPCKGLDDGFERNITSFFTQDYEDYEIWFVVAEKSDPAYSKLLELRENLAGRSRAGQVRVLVAGTTQGCSQKVHNLLHACRQIGEDVLIMAFADSDACVRPQWLAHLVYPLRSRDEFGAASGYRWFIPAKVNVPTLALSSMNARVAQLLGPYGFNHAWGGSMAIRRDIFHLLKIDEVWSTSISDDLSMSRAIRQAKMTIAFVPGCLVASYVSVGWRELFEFARRQFVITRVATPGLWGMGLVSSMYSVLGLWGGLAATIWAWAKGDWRVLIWASVPVAFLLGHFVKAGLRQKMIEEVIADESSCMKAAKLADIFLSWLWSPLLLGLILSSSVGRKITWRGIQYKLLGPTNVIVLGKK
jgi:ceramide glucosyltransferase